MEIRFELVLVILAVACLSVSSAYAVNSADSAPLNAYNYSSTIVKVPNCASYGGDPNGDGICKNWKDGTYGSGLHIVFTDSSIGNTPVTYRYDLPCTPGNTIANDPTGLTVCPSTSRKDIYVELDCMTGQCPSSQVIADVVTAFNNRGINLHVQLGEKPVQNSGDIGVHYCDVRMVTTNYDTAGNACTSSSSYYQSYPYLKQNFFGTQSERAGTAHCPLNNVAPGTSPPNAYAYNCLTAKRQVFHYGMFVNYQWGAVPSSGWAEVFGNDFLVSLGNFTNGTGSLDEQEGAFMHELGHNLGLNHGGVSDTNNCKPNYLSVMNYEYMFKETADSCRPLDYSSTALSTLNESSLKDSNIGLYPYPYGSACSGERKIFWSSPTGSILNSTAGVTNDWDNNGQDSNPYSQILNNLGPSCGASPTPVALTGFNDWSFIFNGNSALGIPEPLNFRNSTNFYQGSLPAGNLDHEFVPGMSHYDVPLPPVYDNTAASVMPSSTTASQGSAVTFTVTVTDIATSPTTPTGTVSWGDGGAGGTFGSSSCTLSSGSCSVSYTSSSSAPSSITITASYGGDSTHLASTGTSSLSVTTNSWTEMIIMIVIAIAVAIVAGWFILRRRK